MSVPDDGRTWRTALAWVVRLPVEYCVVLGVVAVCYLATWWGRWVLGDDPLRADVERFGYGVPSLSDGRPWTFVTGMFLTPSLAVPFPLFTLIGVALYERVAGHWRALVAVVGGQAAGMAAVALLLWPLESLDGVWLDEITSTIDFGISIGGFACLGAWTAHLGARWRRRFRLGLSCYFVGPLLLSGLIYDLSHPVGWAMGLVFGQTVIDGTGDEFDRRAVVPSDRRALMIVALIGGAAGAYAGWTGGGIGGIFGWGPGVPGT